MEDKNLTKEDLNEDQLLVLNRSMPKNYYKYKLKGIVVHYGTSDQGHYYTFIQDREGKNEGWFEFNDTIVREFDPSEIAEETFGGEDKNLAMNMQNNGQQMDDSEREKYRKQYPTLLQEGPNFRLWHKMDHFWRVPKTFIRLSLVSPKTYESPRAMTLSRIYQRVLNDDLNSFVYDASLAGCNYR